MQATQKIESIYFDSNPNGIIIRKFKVSMVTAFVIPRTMLSEAKQITGIKNTGIYYLIQSNEENSINELYIGQTINGIQRMDDHKYKKLFWNKAILFLSNNDDFDASMLNGLESYAIEKAIESNRYKVDNKLIPKDRIKEYDLSDISKIYQEIKFLMATFGYELDNKNDSIKNQIVLKTSRRNIVGLGVYENDKFELLEGSEIDFSKPTLLDAYNVQRKEYLDNGYITKIDDKYILNKTITFKTPSGASDFVLGGSTNGWKEWKSSNGTTLDELYRK